MIMPSENKGVRTGMSNMYTVTACCQLRARPAGGASTAAVGGSEPGCHRAPRGTAGSAATACVAMS